MSQSYILILISTVLVNNIVPVSYTHLDVYKRQGMSEVSSRKGAKGAKNAKKSCALA